MTKIKNILLLAVATLLVGLLTGCGSNQEVIDMDSMYGGMPASSYQDYIVKTFDSISQMPEEDMEVFCDDDAMAQYIEAGYFDQSMVDVIKSWAAAKEDCGEFVEYTNFSISEDNGVVTAIQTMNMTGDDAIFTLVADSNNMTTTARVEPIVPLGKTMVKAGQNTLMGIGTVFIMLIVMCLIISLFKVINNIQTNYENKKKDAEYVEPAADSAFVQQVSQREAVQNDGGELIAVIAAAIAASTGTSTDDFVVRSIKRRG